MSSGTQNLTTVARTPTTNAVENGIQADATLEPLPVLIHQRDDADRCAGDIAHEGADVIERLLIRAIENAVAAQFLQPCSVVGRDGGLQHRCR